MRKLTERQTQVLQLVAEGCINKVIGARLKLPLHTVERNVVSLRRHFKAQNRTQLAVKAIRMKVIK